MSSEKLEETIGDSGTTETPAEHVASRAGDEQKSGRVTDEDDKKSLSVTDIGEIPSPSVPTHRRTSNLTIENLKLHEEVVAREEYEKSCRGSGSPVKTSSQQSIPRTSSPLAPLKGGQRTGSGNQARPGTGQRSNRGQDEDGVASPVPSGESLRTGSGKPLPPIGVEKVAVEGELNTERQDSFTDDNGAKTSMPRILGYRRERPNDNESETMESARSARAESLTKSERSVSFVDSIDRPAAKASKTPKRNVSSPACREVIRRKNPDGSEKVAISIATETEWSWLESVKMVGQIGEKDLLSEIEAKEMKTPPTSGLPRKKRHRMTSMSSVSHLSEESDLEDDIMGLQESEERLEDVESEYSDDDIGPLPSGTMIPRIGPPRIIQYQRESERIAAQPSDPSQRTHLRRPISTGRIEFQEEDEYVSNDEGNGMSAAPSRSRIRKGGSSKKDIRKSESRSGTTSPEMPEVAGGPCEFCNEEIKPFPTPEMQQTMSPEEMFESGLCEFCEQEMKAFPTLEMHNTMPAEQLYCCEEYQRLVEFTLANAEGEDTGDELIDIAPHAPYGSKQARRAAKERAAARLREREMARQRAAGANQANFYAIARQMKTINYALSSQRCMDEGWTLRPPTPSDDGYEGPEPYEPQPVFHPPIMALKQKSKPDERNIVKKNYTNGQFFMVMFEDGTGTIFYPSGNAAIVITSSEKGQYEYFVLEDTRGQNNLLAVFEPNGRATCYQNNGQIKLNLTPHGGIYLDQRGAVKKRWLWKDPVTHVHAPPFQPICFALNKALSLRCMGQDQIFLQFNQEKQTIRFNVGVKLKLVKPENLPKDEVDEHLLYLADIKAYFKVVTDKIQNAIKFSKSPKLDNLRPPYKVQKDLIRNEKLKTRKVQQQVTSKGSPIVTVN